MVAYRFCRPDDAALIVRAVNQCYDVHFSSPGLTLSAFQAEVRELNTWPSNCMVASAGEEPIAVCVAAKRESEVLIQRVGVRPGNLRQGHGRHLLSSLSQKLGVLGPPRLVSEVPDDLPAGAPFFQALGFEAEEKLSDLVLDLPLQPSPATEALVPVGVEELVEGGFLKDSSRICWQRQVPTLLNRSESLKGTALLSAENLLAFLLTRRNEAERWNEICAWTVFAAGDETVLISLLLRYHAQNDLPFVLPRASPEEISPVLQELGFRVGRQYTRYARGVED